MIVDRTHQFLISPGNATLEIVIDKANEPKKYRFRPQNTVLSFKEYSVYPIYLLKPYW